MSLPERRLTKTRDFQNVFSKGRGFREESLFLKIRTNGDEPTKFGIVISKKVAKQAVVRNRMRRLLKEALREEEKSVREGVQVVLVVLPGFEDKGLKETREAVHRLFKKASLLQ